MLKMKTSGEEMEDFQKITVGANGTSEGGVLICSLFNRTPLRWPKPVDNLQRNDMTWTISSLPQSNPHIQLHASIPQT